MIRVLGYKKNKKIAFCLGDGCGLGNLLQALPAVQALHDAGHTCDLYLSGFIYPDSAGVVRGQPYVRDIYENTYDNKEEIYDLCVVSFLSDHQVVNAKKYLKLKRNWEKTSEWGQYCRVAEKLGAKSFKAPCLNVSDRQFNLQPPSIVIHAGCSHRKHWERKKWTHYEELAGLMLRGAFHVYCCGTEDEILNHPEVTAYNNLPIQETAALIQQCDLFVSNDSGLMHLAAALRKRQIAIFTATSDRKSGPYYNPYARVIKPKLTCYPCNGNEKVWNECASWKCRDSIAVDEVYDHIKDVMHQVHSNAVSATS